MIVLGFRAQYNAWNPKEMKKRELLPKVRRSVPDVSRGSTTSWAVDSRHNSGRSLHPQRACTALYTELCPTHRCARLLHCWSHGWEILEAEAAYRLHRGIRYGKECYNEKYLGDEN